MITNSNRIIVVFSLGQLISSNLEILKASFTEFFKAMGKNNTGEEVWDYWDTSSILGDLRTDKRTIGDVHTDFQQHFDVKISLEDFLQKFKSMSKVDKSVSKRIEELYNYLQEDDDTLFLVISHTNWAHFEYIMEQLKSIIPVPSNKNEILPNNKDLKSRIVFAPSMLSKKQDHTDTFNWACEQLKLQENSDSIVSFLNTIQSNKSVGKNFNHFEYKKLLPSWDAGEVTDFLNEVKQELGLKGPSGPK